MKLRFLAAGLALLGVTAAAGAQTNVAPAALLAAVAATQSAKLDYAFDFDFTTTKAAIRAHFDPKATPHIHMLQPAEAQLNDDQRGILTTMQQQMEGLGWCAGERMGHVTNVRLEHEDADTATYSFQPTRESTRGQASQYADRLRGELTMSKTNPDITAIHIFTPAAFDPIPFVHIASVDIAVTCATAPNGRRYGALSESRTSGSAFGQSLDTHNVQRVSNLSTAP